jgi:hypothetical protein
VWHKDTKLPLTTVSVTNFLYFNLYKKTSFLKTMLAMYGFYSENIFWKNLTIFEPLSFAMNCVALVALSMAKRYQFY